MLLFQENTGVGTLGSVYTVSYYNNQPAVATNVQDTFQALDTGSLPFCEYHARIHLSHMLVVACGPDFALLLASPRA
jgi:hypothetical protein